MANKKENKGLNRVEDASLQVNTDPETAKGVYSNLARIVFSENEFVLGFVLKIGDEAQLVSRVIVSPEHMENLSEAIQKSLKEYKDQYGE